MLKKIALQPGINKEGTSYSAEGGWYDSDKIRFRKGRPEKIGGWVKASENTFLGTCRTLHNWTTINKDDYLGVGTNLKAYVEFSGTYYDITPQMYKTTTYLDAAAAFDDTTLDLNAAVTSGSLLRVGNEYCTADGTGPGSTDVTRGKFGTTETAHSKYDPVFEIPKLEDGIGLVSESLKVLINYPDHGLATNDYVRFLYLQDAISVGAVDRSSFLTGYDTETSLQGFRISQVLNASNFEIEIGDSPGAIGGKGKTTIATTALTPGSIVITLAANASVELGSVNALVRVDNEYIKLTGVSGSEPDYTCDRGQYGSTATDHSIGTTVYQVDTASVSSSASTLKGGEMFILADVSAATSSYSSGSGWGSGTWGGVPTTAVSSEIATGEGINSSEVAEVVLVDSSSFETSGYILINYELISYTSNSGTALGTLGRAKLGTIADVHSAGATVYFVDSSWTAWNAVTALPVNLAETTIRIWSMDNWGEDLVLCPRDGIPYFWNQSQRTSDSEPVKIVNSEAGATVNTGVYYASPIPLSSMGIPNADPSSSEGDIGHGSVPDFVRQLMVYPSRRVIVAFGCSDTLDNFDPMLVRWCDEDRPGSWQDEIGNVAGGNPLQTGSYIVGAARSKREIVIWTDEAFYVMRPAPTPAEGDPDYVFAFTELSTGLSIISPNAFCVSGDNIFWMDDRNFYVYDGTVNIVPCSVLEYVFGDISYSEREKIFAARNSNFGEVTWFYPSEDSEINDRYVTYNYVEGSWAVGSMSRSAWSDSGIRQYPHGAYLYDADAEASVLYLHENGNDADGSAMTSYVESGYMDIDDGEQLSFVSRFIPDIRYSNGPSVGMDIKLTPKEFPNSSEGTMITTAVTSSTDQARVRMRGRQFSIRFESTGSGVGWTLGDTRIDIRPDGRR